MIRTGSRFRIASCVATSWLMACGGTSDGNKNSADHNANHQSMGTAAGQEPAGLVGTLRNTGRYLFYIKSPGGLYAYDKDTYQSKEIISDYKYAGIAAPQGGKLFQIDKSAGLSQYSDPGSAWFITDDWKLFRFDAETGRTVAVPTSVDFSKVCSEVEYADDAITFYLQADGCEAAYFVNVYTGGVTSQPRDETFTDPAFNASGGHAGDLTHADGGGIITYKEQQGRTFEFNIGTYAFFSPIAIADTGAALVFVAETTKAYVSDSRLLRFTVNKSDGRIQTETLTEYGEGSVTSVTSGARAMIQISFDENSLLLYEDALDPAQSQVVSDDLRSIEAIMQRKVLVVLDNEYRLYDLQKGRTLADHLVYRKEVQAGAFVRKGKRNFYINYDELKKLDRINTDTLDVLTFENTLFFTTLGDGRYETPFVDGVFLGMESLGGKEYFFTGVDVENFESVGHQGSQVSYFDEAQKKMIPMGKVKNKISYVNSGCGCNEFLLGNAYLMDESSVLLWLDGRNNTFGELALDKNIYVMGQFITEDRQD